MSQDDDEEEGRFIAFLNSRKQAGDNKPAFEGKLTLPEETDERRAVLWAHTTKTGNTLLAGKVGRSASEQIDALVRPPQETGEPEEDEADGKELDVAPDEILLFKNDRKDGKQPDYWGYYNPGSDAPLMRLAVWAKNDAGGKAMLSGSVKVYEPEFERSRQRGRGR